MTKKKQHDKPPATGDYRAGVNEAGRKFLEMYDGKRWMRLLTAHDIVSAWLSAKGVKHPDDEAERLIQQLSDSGFELDWSNKLEEIADG